MKSNRLERAIMSLNARQMASQTHSHIADIDARAQLVVTIVYLISLLSVPVHSPGMLVWFAVYPIISAPLAHIAYEKLFKESLYVLPLLIIIGVFNPVYDRSTAFMIGNVAISNGWVSFFAVIIRGLLSVQALLLLIYVVGFNNMCTAMYSLKVPKILVTQLLMVYRYMAVLLQEALTMQRARQARGYGRKSYRAGMWGAFVGQLLIRTIERSRRIDMAMNARGFNGTLPVSGSHRWNTADTVFCMIWIPVFALMRFADISSFMLQLFRI